MAIKTRKIDITAAGYAVVREAFNATLQLCIDRLTKAEQRLAEEILDIDLLDEDTPGFHETLADTALYSRKRTRLGPKKKRAIDRIAPIVVRVHDPLRSAIAARLPLAVYSIYKVAAAPDPGLILAHDLFDDDRTILIMDNGLAQSVARNGGTTIAGRFVDLGAWSVGFGIVKIMRKSEVLAISLALAGLEDRDDARDALHELIYPAQLHGENLVMAALEPMILALSAAVDADLVDPDDITAGLGSLLSSA